ncbi:MAG TPA: TonB-dependent receptor [Povalibacter sp.]|nr:TonB-dependent receptor [Povalibacter sp.]
MSTNTALRRAIQCALLAGAATAAVPEVTLAQQTTDTIQEVVVTGSRIRRVDTETASPVFVIDTSAITSSGVQTLGDLIQRTPAIAGAATNPQVNNGGGTGESNVELRGLGAQRTLVLLNGRRIGILGNTTTSAVDINMIPINLIERVEVLKEGAGAVYGSDAIAGVVNFITKKNWDGAEASVEYGQTGKSDGERQTASLSFGSTGDKLSVLVGGNYNKQEGVSAADRDFSRYALYLYGGVVSQGGSSRTPTGRIELPDNLVGTGAGQFDCSAVTHIPGANSGTFGDYRCYTNADAYNYQPFNLLITPQERASLFTLANYKINDSLEAYTEVIYNQTRSGFEIAPLPFDAVSDDTIISADNAFNPFGTDFGGVDGLNPNLRNRFVSLGNRRSEVHTKSTLFNAGLRGDLPMTQTWQWDANVSIGNMSQDQNIDGYLLKPQLAQALGPTDASGENCLTQPGGAVIAGCTPIDIFNVQDPVQVERLRALSTNYRTDYKYRSQAYSLNLNGELFDLPAGAVSAAFGAEYRYQQGVFESDVLTRGTPPLFLSCLLAQETCTGNSSADYNVKELYAEFFVPLLKDLPGVRALNLTAGVRYSDYSRDTIGDSTNAQFKVEYRPINDVLLRASYAEVFRAPTIVDLSQAPTQNAPTFADPCAALTSADLAANPNYALACQGVTPDTNFQQPLSQITGLFIGNANLKPETGDVMTFGAVYDVSQVPGLSFTVDYWKYKIEDIITNLDVNFAADQCVATGAPQFCGLMYRYTSGPNAGQFQVFQQPTVNLGELKTDGIDFGVKYALRSTPIGNFNISLDMTKINSYESIAAPGAAPQEIAGTFDRQFGNYAKWRGLLGIGWSLDDFDGLLSLRYTHSLKLPNADGANPDPNPTINIPSVTYVDLTVGYTLPTDTRLQVGVTNLTDKDPPIFYQNNVLNANTDVSTYDTLGRRWFVGVTQKF